MKIKETIIKRRMKAVLGTVFVFLAVIAVWRAVGFGSGGGGVPEVPKTAEDPEVRRLLDGVWVLSDFENPPIAGVMVENMIEAQPISGVAEARLVFEAITEANITRFLAYFILDGGKASEASEALPPSIEVGPVRSARPYYLDWASEFNTFYAHVGSSPAAYERLRKIGVEGVYDLDQWYAPQYFFNKDGRRRPHSLYTNTELLRKAYHAREEQMANGDEYEFESWIYKNDAPPDLRGKVADISIPYGEPYAVRWLYDKSENQYKRMQWARPSLHSREEGSVGQGGAHATADGKEIIAKNIAVAFQNMKILDEVGRKEFTTLGEGKALVFQDGRVVDGTWKKPGARERMRFYNAQGDEVEFNAGITWVEIVPEGYEVRF